MDLLTSSGIYGIRNHFFSDERGKTTKAIFSEDFIFTSRQLLSVSNPQARTIRGLHYQVEPRAEKKIISCLSGTIFDVLVNLDSLSTKNPEIFSMRIGEGCEYQGLLAPSNFAHGYLTLSDDVLITYLMDEVFDSNCTSGLRWDDPKLGIDWPNTPVIISKRDLDWTLL
jgi:dTDP-4-dehydrorhamnose 3,5-epimerase